MKNYDGWAYLYNFNVLDLIIIEKALTVYKSECSYLNYDNVSNTLDKVKKIIGRR